MTAPAADHDKLYRLWLEWIDTSITVELYRAYYDQSIWTAMRDEIQTRHADADTDGTFLLHYSGLYSRAQMVRLRSLTDDAQGTTSLVSLIKAIQKNRQVLTEDRCRSQVRVRLDEQRPGSHDVVGEIVEETLEHRRVEWCDEQGLPRAEILESSLERILSEMNDIKAHVDKRIAHFDRAAPWPGGQPDVGQGNPATVTFADIRQGLDMLAEESNRFRVLLGLSEMNEWAPVFLGDWQEPLRRGLFPLTWRQPRAEIPCVP